MDELISLVIVIKRLKPFAIILPLYERDHVSAWTYFALLIGQQVEYRQRYQPSAADLRIWNAERQKYKNLALRGLTVRETLKKIRSPKWEWRKA